MKGDNPLFFKLGLPLICHGIATFASSSYIYQANNPLWENVLHRMNELQNTNKFACFEFLVDELARRTKHEGAEFTTLSILKLLFFVVGSSCSSDKPGLTVVFNSFAAMPYGPVELEVYERLKADGLEYFTITKDGMTRKKELPKSIIEPETYRLLSEEVDKLLERNPDILDYPPFDLVYLSHRWSCWQLCYERALCEGVKQARMDGELIQQSTKYFRK